MLTILAAAVVHVVGEDADQLVLLVQLVGELRQVLVRVPQLLLQLGYPALEVRVLRQQLLPDLDRQLQVLLLFLQQARYGIDVIVRAGHLAHTITA